jgi:hypothetical protein
MVGRASLSEPLRTQGYKSQSHPSGLLAERLGILPLAAEEMEVVHHVFATIQALVGRLIRQAARLLISDAELGAARYVGSYEHERNASYETV